MVLQQKKLVLAGMILIATLLLAACDSSGGTNTGSTQGSSSGASPTITPQQVTPKSSTGSPGKGPQIVFSPTPVPGGKAGSQQVVLGDRTLVINSVVKQKDPSTNATLITLDLTVQNTSGKSIMNQSTFFELLGAEGDAFGYQYNSSDTFYGSIAAHTNRNGTIMFQIPAAAASNLRLMYRPEIASEMAIVLLKIA